MRSRSQRPAKRGTSGPRRRADLTVLPSPDQGCGCPDCTEGGLNPEQMLTDLVDDACTLVEVEDPLEAELAGALFAAMARAGGDETMAAFAGAFVPAIEARGTRAALTLLTAKSNGPAPVYQIKVSLRGAKPPIWRRLLVPGDITLNRLHQTILAVFGWHGGHLHVFDTVYGQFGRADRDLGHRSDGPVTLEQVAPAVKDKLRYTYDFGDDWRRRHPPTRPPHTRPVWAGGARPHPTTAAVSGDTRT
jgi:Plasmid pRiA4b ORF-3-like protein